MSQKQSYTDFISEIAKDTGIPESVVRSILESGIRIISEKTYHGTQVEIRNFGVFGTKRVHGRVISLNNTHCFSDYTKFWFRPSKKFTKANRIAIGEITDQPAGTA